jgi:hypothetical protein
VALIRNGLALSANPMRVTAAAGLYGIQRSTWTPPSAQRGLDCGEGTVIGGASIADTAGRPNGYEARDAWLLPRRGGGLAAYTSIEHGHELAAGLAMGAGIGATLVSDGALSTAAIAALANLTATLTGPCATSAAMLGVANLAAAMTSDGDLDALLSTYALLVCTAVSDGSISTADLGLIAGLASSLVSDGSLSTAALGLTVAMTCSLLSDCAVTADVRLVTQLAATMAAGGDLTGALEALAHLVSTMLADGSLDGSALRGTLGMSAELTTAGSAAELTASGIAAAVWSSILSGNAAGVLLAQMVDVASDAALARKVAANRLEVTGFGGGVSLVLYDDDGTTVLHTWTLTTHGGEAVTTYPGAQTKRSAPA